MKKTIILTVFIFAYVFGFSQIQQTKTQETSNAEKFSNKSGTLIKKEFIDIGMIKGVSFQVAYYTDLGNGQKESALRIEYTPMGKITRIAHLDSDEIEGLAKTLKIIQTDILSSQVHNYTEVSFKSRGGFVASCYTSSGVFSKSFKWKSIIRIDNYDYDSTVSLDKEDLPLILDLLNKAVDKL